MATTHVSITATDANGAAAVLHVSTENEWFPLSRSDRGKMRDFLPFIMGDIQITTPRGNWRYVAPPRPPRQLLQFVVWAWHLWLTGSES